MKILKSMVGLIKFNIFISIGVLATQSLSNSVLLVNFLKRIQKYDRLVT